MSSDDVPAAAAPPATSSSSTSNDHVAATLLQLLTSFPASTPAEHQKIEKVTDLNDGISLFHFLHYLEPGHFELDSLQNSISDPSSRQQNLQYLLDCLETFFEESLGKSMNLGFLDVAKMSSSIASEADESLVQLLELVLLCAINSSKKEEVIHAIMAMEDGEQQVLMNVIHNMQLRADQKHGSDLTSELEQAHATHIKEARTPTRKESFETTTSDGGELASPIASPAASTSASHSSGAAFPSATSQAELTKLRNELSASQNESISLHKTIDTQNKELKEWKRKAYESEEKYNKLQADSTVAIQQAKNEAQQEAERVASDRSKNELQRLNKDLTRSEARVKELEFNLKQASDSLLTSQRELATLGSELEEKQTEISHLKDELQLASNKTEEFEALQTKLEKMKSRLAEIDELKSSLAALEKENTQQLDRIIELESESKEIDTLKQQLTRMKDTAFQAESTLLDKTLAAEQAQDALREVKEESQLLRQERQNLEKELKGVKQELELVRAQGGKSSSNSLGSDFTDTTSTGSDDKATIRRLEFELSKLKKESAAASASAASNDGASTESDLSLLRQQKESLQSKYLDSQRKLAQLQSEHTKALKQQEEKLMNLEKQLEEEKDKWKDEREDLVQQISTSKSSSTAGQEELTQLRQELIELHEQLDTLRGGATSGSLTTTAAAETPKTPSRTSSASATNPPTPTAAAAGTTPDIDALTLRNKKLEAYIKQTQKKQKLLEEAQEKTQQQLQQTHEAYKVARQQLIDRERELVEREKSRVADTTNSTRERKLLSAAFYSMGMEYQSSLMAGRAVAKNGTATPAGRSWLSQQRMAAANQS